MPSSPVGFPERLVELTDYPALPDARYTQIGHNHDDRYMTDAEIASLLLSFASDEELDVVNARFDDYLSIADAAGIYATQETLAGYAPLNHNHDGVYSLVGHNHNGVYSVIGHTHDDRYYTETEVNTMLGGYAVAAHTHDDRYYTEAETNNLVANVAKTNVANTFTAEQTLDAGAVVGVQDVVWLPTPARPTKADWGWRVAAKSANSEVLDFFWGEQGQPGYFHQSWEMHFVESPGVNYKESYAQTYLNGQSIRQGYWGVYYDDAHNLIRTYWGGTGALEISDPSGALVPYFARFGPTGSDTQRPLYEFNSSYPAFATYNARYPVPLAVLSNYGYLGRPAMYITPSVGSTVANKAVFFGIGHLVTGRTGDNGSVDFLGDGSVIWFVPREYAKSADSEIYNGHAAMWADFNGSWSNPKLAIRWKRNDGGAVYQFDLPMVRQNFDGLVLTSAGLTATGPVSATNGTFSGTISVGGLATFARQTVNANAALLDGASISWNLDTAPTASVTLGGNRTLANPTNMKAGGTYLVIVKQDATGGRTLAYGTAYKWPSGSAPVLSTAANATDILTFVSDGTSMFGVAQKGFA